MPGIIEQERYTCGIGALQSVVAIPRAVPILHSGPGCGTMIAGFFERSTGYAGGNTSPCTNFSEREVIFGGVEKLRGVIENASKILDSDLQVILTGCTSAIIGDDIESAANDFLERGFPIVHAETAGFKLSNFEAHSVIANAVIDQYADRFTDENPPRSEKSLVNLFASIPYQDLFWKGNLREYKRLLEGLGLRVNVLFGPRSRGVAEWRSIPRANFNILVSPWYGWPIVKNLEEKYGQPFFHFRWMPIGANETTRFLRGALAFALAHGADLDEEKACEFIEKEEHEFYEELDNLATFLLEFRYGLPNHVHILHDSGYVLGFSKFLLHETGMVPKESFATENTPEEYFDVIRADMDSTSAKRSLPLFFEPDAGKAQDMLRSITHKGRGLIIGSSWEKELAKEKGFDYLPASVPSSYRLAMTTNYIGYSGGLRVIEDIYGVVLGSYD
ncbi:MAG: hydrogenase [Clostridiales bacterium]|jgi:nitrogenase molybdenum-iron protein beta chain|nr:hydrogenase [Clostridiales bacterium]